MIRFVILCCFLSEKLRNEYLVPSQNLSWINAQFNIYCLRLEKILLLYYFYNRFPLNKSKKVEEKLVTNSQTGRLNAKKMEYVNQLIYYIKNNYSLKDKILVFHPNTHSSIIDLCKTTGINFILFMKSYISIRAVRGFFNMKMRMSSEKYIPVFAP